MGLDLKRMKEVSVEIRKQAESEMMSNISTNLINFVLDDTIIDSFKNEKGRKITEQSKRVIGHWVKEGVISGVQKHEGGWYYFDRTESVWIDIVTQLREFGLSLQKLKKIREQLFAEIQIGFRLIDFALMHSVLRTPYIMIVNTDGNIKLTTVKLYSDIVGKETLPPHIAFNFFHLAKEIFPNNKLDVISSNPNKLSDLTTDEMKILYYIRTGDYKEIKIIMKQGEVYLLETERDVPLNNKIIDIINNAAYQDITIKVNDSKIVHIKSTQKIKP